MSRPPVPDARRFAAAYAIYTLFHLVLAPLHAVRGLLRARKRGYQRISWARLTGGGRPPCRGRWLVVVAGGIGEARAAIRVAEEAARSYGIQACVMVHRSDAMSLASNVPVLPLPFNNPLSAWWCLRRNRPWGVIVAEFSDNHHLMALAALRGVPSVVFNVLLSEHETQRQQRAHELWRLQMVGAWDVHGDAQRQRLLRLGVDPRRIASTGPVGVADVTPLDAAQEAPIREAWLAGVPWLAAARPLVVAGATHAADEKRMLDAFAALREVCPDAGLVLAPREPRRADALAQEAVRRGWAVARRSQGEPGNGPVLILDTMGELGNLYSVASVAYVGGSFDPVLGAHTPAEAVGWRVPITIGPEYQQQVALVEALRERGLCEVCPDAASLARAWGRRVDGPTPEEQVAARRFLAGQATAAREFLDRHVKGWTP